MHGMGGFKHGGDAVSKEELIAKLDNAVALEGVTKVLRENSMARIEKRRLRENANTLKEDSIREAMRKLIKDEEQ